MVKFLLFQQQQQQQDGGSGSGDHSKMTPMRSTTTKRCMISRILFYTILAFASLSTFSAIGYFMASVSSSISSSDEVVRRHDNFINGMPNNATTTTTTTTTTRLDDDDQNDNDNNYYDVIIVGAGAAGITAAYDLRRKYSNNITIKILEASNRPLGRIKKDVSFWDSPIDLGGEWISVDPKVLKEIVGDDNSLVVEAEIDNLIATKTFRHAAPISFTTKWFGTIRTGMNYSYAGWRWNNYTWYDFWQTYIMPFVAQDIEYESPVTSIQKKKTTRRREDDGTSSVMMVNVQKQNQPGSTTTTTTTISYTTQAVIVAVPLQILKDNDIIFEPPLPSRMQKTIDKFIASGALKAWLEFEGSDEKFFPDLFSLGGDFVSFLNSGDDESRAWWDETWGQTSTTTTTTTSSIITTDADRKQQQQQQQQQQPKQRHILGFFTYHHASNMYTNLQSDKDIIDKILKELDYYFDGKASLQYVKGMIQNWTKEPYIRCGYSYQGIIGYLFDKAKPLREPIRFLDSDDNHKNNNCRTQSNNKCCGCCCQIVLAGEHVAPHRTSGYIHGAAFSGREAVKRLILDDDFSNSEEKEKREEEEEKIIIRRG